MVEQMIQNHDKYLNFKIKKFYLYNVYILVLFCVYAVKFPCILWLNLFHSS